VPEQTMEQKYRHFLEAIKNHVATPLTELHVARDKGDAGTKIEAIQFMNKDGSWTYRMDFIMYRHMLFVGGDLGEAVYCWSQVIDWYFLKDCDFGYFFGKCSASENGARPHDWDHEKATDHAQWYIDEAKKEHEGDDHRIGLIEGEADDLLRAANCTRGDWEEYLRALDEDLRELIFGEEWYEALNMGDTPAGRQWMHWKGLHLALEQLGIVLNEKEKKEA